MGMTTPAMDKRPTASDGPRHAGDTVAPYESRYEKRSCEECGRDTKHLVTDCYAPDGRYSGGFTRCWECPPEQLTARLVPNGLLMHVVITDDRQVAVANRPLAYGLTDYPAADRALTALGFRRITDWDAGTDADTCLVRWR